MLDKIDMYEEAERDAPAAEIVRGTVKWFDPLRGFGFVTSGETRSDVLLHGNVLRDFGQSSILDGSDVTIRVDHGTRGLHAVELLAVEIPEDEAARPPARELLEPLDETLPYLPARVKWFDAAKGFGFANAFNETRDIFVHVKVLRRFGLTELQTGEAICLRAAEGDNGLVALEVRRWNS